MAHPECPSHVCYNLTGVLTVGTLDVAPPPTSVHFVSSSSTSALQSWGVWAWRAWPWLLHPDCPTSFLSWCPLLPSCTSWDSFYIFTSFSSANWAKRATRRTSEELFWLILYRKTAYKTEPVETQQNHEVAADLGMPRGVAEAILDKAWWHLLWM